MISSSIIDPDDVVLVTGANGFVGYRVVRSLIEYGLGRVRCLSRPTSRPGNLERILNEFGPEKIEIVKGNLLSREVCRKAVKNAAVIYHLAAGIEKSFPGCYLNSVVTTRNLVEAALEGSSLKRFVNVSSIAVYSNEKIRWGGILDESCAVDTRFVERSEPYVYGKAKQDELVLEYARDRRLPHVIVRPSVVFGPGKAKITDRIGSSTFGLFLHLGLGNRIPLTYVDNCADAIVLAGLIEGIDGQVFNITDDELPTSRQFLRKYKRHVRHFISIPVPYPIWHVFCSLWGWYSNWSEGQIPPVFNRRTCSIYWKRVGYSNEKAKSMLGWKMKVPMKDGLDRFFSYMREVERNKTR